MFKMINGLMKANQMAFGNEKNIGMFRSGILFISLLILLPFISCRQTEQHEFAGNRTIIQHHHFGFCANRVW